MHIIHSFNPENYGSLGPKGHYEGLGPVVVGMKKGTTGR